MTEYAIVSSSAWRDYQFPLPITALLWREVVGIEPVCLLVGDWTEHKRSKVTAEALFHHGIKFLPLGSIAGYEDPNFSQNCRQHAAADRMFKPEDYLITSDADLWVLSKEWMQRGDRSKMFVSWYANGDHYQSLPTCHIGATTATWRRIMKIEPYEDIQSATKRSLDEWLKPRIEGKGPSDAGWVSWMSDQWRTTEVIKNEVFRDGKWTDDIQLIERVGHSPLDRLDRGCWVDNPDYTKYLDSHILRPADQPEFWPRIRALIAHFLPKHMDWVDQYHADYLAGY